MSNSELQRSRLLVKKSPIHGFGVFADQDFLPGDIIEECYTLYHTTKDNEFIDYIFTSGKGYALPLGYGAIYNHSNQPNADYQFDIEASITFFQAKRLIQKGEEIVVFYGKNWFDSRGLKPKEPSLKFKLRKLFSFMLLTLRFTIVASAFIALLIFLQK